jgi:hypothetical protein
MQPFIKTVAKRYKGSKITDNKFFLISGDKKSAGGVFAKN